MLGGRGNTRRRPCSGSSMTGRRAGQGEAGPLTGCSAWRRARFTAPASNNCRIECGTAARSFPLGSCAPGVRKDVWRKTVGWAGEVRMRFTGAGYSRSMILLIESSWRFFSLGGGGEEGAPSRPVCRSIPLKPGAPSSGGFFPRVPPVFPPEPHVQLRLHEPPVLAELEGRHALLLNVAIERPRSHFQVAARLGGGQHLIPYRLGHRTFRMIRSPS